MNQSEHELLVRTMRQTFLQHSWHCTFIRVLRSHLPVEEKKSQDPLHVLIWDSIVLSHKSGQNRTQNRKEISLKEHYTGVIELLCWLHFKTMLILTRHDFRKRPLLILSGMNVKLCYPNLFKSQFWEPKKSPHGLNNDAPIPCSLLGNLQAKICVVSIVTIVTIIISYGDL